MRCDQGRVEQLTGEGEESGAERAAGVDELSTCTLALVLRRVDYTMAIDEGDAHGRQRAVTSLHVVTRRYC